MKPRPSLLLPLLLTCCAAACATTTGPATPQADGLVGAPPHQTAAPRTATTPDDAAQHQGSPSLFVVIPLDEEQRTASGAHRRALDEALPMQRPSVSLDLRGADVREVMALIAERGGVNIVLTDEVRGQVTMRVSRVPLDQVFLAVVRSLELDYTRRGSILVVAPRQAPAQTPSTGA